MSFVERIQNAVFFAVWSISDLHPEIDKEIMDQYQTYGRFKSDSELASRSAFWIYTHDPMLDYSKPTQSHLIIAGGLTTQPGKPLLQPFEKIVSNAKDGVILVTFGSTVESVPTEIILRFFQAFSQLKQTVIWRLKRGSFEVPANVHLFDWLPQNDLLAHRNVILFVTHCGNNGQHEALYHGKPMIGFPIMADQLYNAKMIEYKGYGLMMSILNFKSEDLVQISNEVINNPKYSQAIKKASRIFHSRPDTGAEISAGWIEHVLEFGSDHLRPYSLEMPWYQFWMVDVLVVLLLVVLIVVHVMILVVWCICKKCRKGKGKEKLQ